MKMSFKTGSTLAALSLLYAGNAFAQGDAVPDEIIITGLRTPIALDEMASAVTVIDREALDLRQSFQLADILRDVPGMTIARSGPAGSQAQLRMRGAEANHVLVLIDGVEANDPASGDEFLFEHLSALEIERVEVIRGPQSALWGSDAVAGVINIVTREAADGPSGGASFEGGANNTWRHSLRAGWGAEKWRFNAGLSRSESDGTNVSRAGSEDDGYELTTVQTRLTLKPNDILDVTLTARHVEAENETDPDIDGFFLKLPFDGDKESRIERNIVSGIGRAEFGQWSYQASVSLFKSENDSLVNGALESAAEAERFKVSLQATAEPIDGHRITGAMDYRETDFVQAGAIIDNPDPYSDLDPNHSQFTRDTGYVLDYVGQFTRDLTITGSVRYDDYSDFDNIATFRLGASFALNEQTRLRGSLGRGHKTPTMGDRFGFYANTFIGNPDLKPEISDSVEVGVDHTMKDGDIVLGATYFKAKLEDEINGFFFDGGLGAFTAINKDGESRRQGVELTLDAHLTDHLSLSSNYTWTDSEEPDDMGGYREEIRRPEHAGVISLIWTGESGASVGLNVTMVSETTDLNFVPYPAELVVLKEYALIGFTAQAPINETVEIYARVQKPTNDSYEDVFGYATPDIDFAVGLRLSF